MFTVSYVSYLNVERHSDALLKASEQGLDVVRSYKIGKWRSAV